MNFWKQQGSVLILVMWVLAITGVIVTFMFYRDTAEWAGVLSFERKAQFSETADGVLHDRLFLLATDDTPDVDLPKEPWFGQTGRNELEKNGFQITVIIEDEGSKPNLNLIGPSGLNYLINQKLPTDPEVDPQDPQVQMSSDSILDWRDTDGPDLSNGAKLDYYQGLTPPYKPRNGFFSSVEEIKQLRYGDKLYQHIAPWVTVYGLINPNMIHKDTNKQTFASMLRSYRGLDESKDWIDRVATDFQIYQNNNKLFKSMEDFHAQEFIADINIMTFDKLKPLFKFNEGSCNVNLVSKPALTAFVLDAGLDGALARNIIEQRNQNPQEPFPNIEAVRSVVRMFGGSIVNNNNFPIDDYFTVKSTIIRFKIWVVKGETKYYLDTVWERNYDTLKQKWALQLLARRTLWNTETPEIPKAEDDTQPNQAN